MGIIDAPPAAEDQPDAALEAMEAEAEPATADLADEPPTCVGQREHAHEHEHEHEQELLVSVSSELEETESAPTVDGTPVAAVVASPVSTAPATAPVENEDCSESDAVCRVPEAYRVQVGKLLEMGYGEDFTIDRLIELVAANNGDLRATIFALLEQ